MGIMKRLVCLMVAVLLVGLMSSIAFAHGTEGRRGHHGTDTARSLCNVTGCNETQAHRHGITYYYGHSVEDGHVYHAFCSVEDCTLTGVHQHDGAYYFEHTLEDGHDYHKLCTVEGCTEVTEHTHDACLHHGNGHHKTAHS